ncbi:MAG: response regulator transcription factor [Candidatus Krumholzibacteriota bacterium]|nr:response regulator transcription factor [Candidatus Krumholzibacteriota bacterium]
MEDLRILLVDDEQDIVDTVKYSLELRGYAVDVAYDGPSALVKARKGCYDVMILDVMLPGKNGYEVSRLLKEDAEKGRIEPLGIILFTARRLHNELREDFVSTWSKADASIYKPFEMEDLLEKIAEVAVVSGRRQEQG